MYVHWQCKVNSFKELLHRLPPYDGLFLDKYPEHPRDLPTDILTRAYSPNDPPIVRFVHRYESLAKHVPLRKSSKLLAGTDMRSASAGGGRQSMIEAVGAFVQQYNTRGNDDDEIPITYNTRAIKDREYDTRRGQSWGDYDDWSRHRRGSPRMLTNGDDDVPDAQDFKPKRSGPPTRPCSSPSHSMPRSYTIESPSSYVHSDQGSPDAAATYDSAAYAADTPAPAPAEPAPATPGAPAPDTPAPAPAVRKSSADIEEEAFRRLVKKNVNAKEKQKENAALKAKAIKDAKNKPPVRRRLTSKQANPLQPRTLAKRPASDVQPESRACRKVAVVGDVLALEYPMKWEDLDPTRNRNTFVSRHYGRAKTMLRHMGGVSADDMRATLSVVSYEAGKLYDHKMFGKTASPVKCKKGT